MEKGGQDPLYPDSTAPQPPHLLMGPLGRCQPQLSISLAVWDGQALDSPVLPSPHLENEDCDTHAFVHRQQGLSGPTPGLDRPSRNPVLTV